MSKKRNGIDIKGLSLNGETWLSSQKGFYLEGFHTMIKHATQLDLKNAEKYALELVSRYLKINQVLLSLNKIDENSEMSTTTIVYQVKSGIMINGKIYITAQILDNDNINLSFNFKYRTTSKNFFETVDIQDSKINHENITHDTDSIHWVRHRNKQEIHRLKYKEK